MPEEAKHVWQKFSKEEESFSRTDRLVDAS